MGKVKLYVIILCGILMFLFSLPVQAQETISVNVNVPGREVFSLQMQKTDYIGTVKYKLQDQVDIDLNQMDLLYNGKVLSEVKRFSSGLIPDGATITMQATDRWNYDKVRTVGDKTFSIALPKEEKLTKVYAKDYGMNPDKNDNTEAFVNALKDCSTDAYLVIEQGVYYFRDMAKDIDFNNMENVIIDGNGSKFIFDNKYCMKIYGGNGVEFRNLTVDWDWDKIPIGSLVQIENKQSNYVFDIRFMGVDNVDENIPIGTFMLLDPDDLVVGSYGFYKAYTPGSVAGTLINVEKVESNVLRITHNGNMKHFNEGEIYLLRHFEYNGRVFNTTRYAKNITFNNVKIYGFSGMGWTFSDKANHFQIKNCYLGLDPTKTRERRISTAADAIHILNTGGYFRIVDSDLSFTGDDIINVHDDVMDIMTIDEDRTTLRGWVTSGYAEAGDVLRFRNSQMQEFTDYEAKITSFVTDKNNPYERVVTFSKALPKEITTDCFAYSKSHNSSYYVISGNYIHEARARAALLNDSYGLFENNYVYRMHSGAIGIRSDFSPGRWFEGEGSSHILVANNTFEECNFGAREPMINIGVSIDGNASTEQVLKDIAIKNNVFLNCIHNDDTGQSAVVANNVTALTITGNTLENSGEIRIKDVVSSVTSKDNNPHTEHDYVHGVCTVCNQIWEKTIDGITYRVIVETVKRRPIAVSIPDSTKGEIAVSVVKAEAVDGKAVILAREITDEKIGQKFILTSIEKDVFADSKAASITIPETVTDIGENALGNIKDITYEKKKDSIEKNPDSEKKDGSKGQITTGKTDTKVHKKQTITVSKKVKKKVKVKAYKLRKKKMVIKLGAKAKTKLTYKISKCPKKARKYISVNSKGKVTLKKGCKRGVYKVTINAKKTTKYKAAKRVVTIVVV